MQHLLRSELTRFRGLTIAFAVGHLLLLVAAGTAVDLLSPPTVLLALSAAAYAVLGLALGLVQMRTRTRPEQWIYLLHRPLAPRRIAAALTAAGALVLTVVVALPLLLTLLRLDLLSARAVDLRHYVLPFFGLGLSLAFYFAGCLLALSPSRAAFLVLVLPTFFLTRQADGLWVLLPLALVVAWLAVLAFRAFRPDLSRMPRRPVAVATLALPIGYALFLALSFSVPIGWSLTTIFSEHGIRGLSTFAWNDWFPEGTAPHVGYLDSGAAIRHGLDGSNASALARQVALADVTGLPSPAVARPPVRHQPPFADVGGSFVDPESETRWTFSHDEMLYRGFSTRTGLPVGTLGVETERGGTDPRPFDQVPVAVGEGFLVTDERIYEVDQGRGRPQHAVVRAELPAGPPRHERWTDGFATHRSLAVARSNQALYVFDARALRRDRLDAQTMLRPRARVPYPDGLGEPTRIDVAELVDGHLLSLTFGGRRAERGFQPSRQVVVQVGLDGTVTTRAERSLGEGLPEWLRRRAFVVSPVFQTLHDLTWAGLAPYDPARVGPRDLAGRSLPPSVVWLALLVALASAAGTALLARARRLEAAERRAWTAIAFLLGAPGVLVFAALTRRRAAVPQRAPRAVDGLTASASPAGAFS